MTDQTSVSPPPDAPDHQNRDHIGCVTQWDGLPAPVRKAMLARGAADWKRIFAGVATHNKTWRPLRPPVMTFAAYREIGRISERIARLILQACQRRADNAGELRQRLGVPDRFVDMLDESQPLTEDLLVAVRPDILLSDGVPRFVECNIDSALGGAFDSDGIARRFLEAYQGDAALDGFRIEATPSAVDARFHAMRDALDLAPGASVAVLFNMSTDYPDTDNPEKLIGLLRPVCERGEAAGLSVVVCPVEWLTYQDGRLHAGDTPLDAVLRLYIPQNLPPSSGRQALAEAVAENSVRMFTSSAAWLLGNKAAFAWLWEDLAVLHPDDAELVRRHVPHTELIVDGIQQRAIAGQQDHVLKPTGDYGGAGVVVGREVSPEIWREAVRQAVAHGASILQQYVAADRLSMHFVRMTDGEAFDTEVPFCIAPYLFGGMLAGAYMRFGIPGGGPVVNLGQGALTSGLLLVD